MAELETIVVKFRTDVAEMLRGFGSITDAVKKTTENIAKRFEDAGKALEKTGKKMALYITAPIAAASVLAIKAWDEQAQANVRLAAAIDLAGGKSAEVLPKFQELASAIQEVTTVGDEATLANIQMGKSMGLTDQQAARAAKNAVALSAAFGMNAQSAIRYTAALEQGDTTMLNRYIPSLRAISDDSARAAKAQEILAQAFGVAMASAKEGLGPFRQLANQLGDLGEDFGKIILDGLRPFIDEAKSVVKVLQQLSPETKTTIIQFATLAAVIPPLVIGLGLFLSSLGSIIKLLGLLLTPVGLVVAGLTALATTVIFFSRTAVVAFQGVYDAAKDWLVAKFTNNVQRPFIELLNDMLSALPEKLQNWLGFTSLEVPPEVKADFVKSLSDAFAAAKAQAGKDVADLKATIAGVFDATAIGRAVKELLDALGALDANLGSSAAKIDALVKGFSDLGKLPTAVLGALIQATKELAQENKGLDHLLETYRQMPEAIDAVTDSVELSNEAFKQKTDLNTKEGQAWAAQYSRNQQLKRDLANVAQLYGDTRTAEEKYAEAVRRLNDDLARGAINQDLYNRGLQKAKDDLDAARSSAYTFKQGVNDLGSAFGGFIRSSIAGTDTLRTKLAALSDRLQDLAFNAAWGVLQDQLNQLFRFNSGGGGGGFLSTIVNSLFGSSTSGYTYGAEAAGVSGVTAGYAQGAAFTGGLHLFGNGGVLTGPRIFPMANGMGLAGEAGYEAVMPLQRTASGKLGVIAQGGGGNTQVIVQNYSSEPAQTERRKSGDLEQIYVMIGKRTGQNIRTPGTPEHRAIRDTFGSQMALTGAKF